MDLLGNRIEEANMDPKAKLSIQPQQQKQDDDDDDDGLARKAHKLSMRYSIFKCHPDIMRVIKKKQLDSDGNLQYLMDYGSDGSDIDSGDEELTYVPTEENWLKMCVEKWHGDDLVSKVRAEEREFEIYTAGFHSQNGVASCGAILRDSCHRPIIAISKIIYDDKKIVSQFLLELEGVKLGFELAKKYNVFPFYILCSSEEVIRFVHESEATKSDCYCSGRRELVDTPCTTCSTLLMLPKDYEEDRDEALKIIDKIFSEISDLESMGLPWYEVTSGTSESACCVAKLEKDQELGIMEIGDLKDLWATIYEEVFGQYI
ncbi:hypothetical protein MKW94_005085, partial [Papaver nudicaule]|nr:hypothetical protein [Papaver nudicaule]